MLSSNCQSPVWEIGQGEVLLVVGWQLKVSSLGEQSEAVPCVEQQLTISSLGDWPVEGAPYIHLLEEDFGAGALLIREQTP